MRFLLATGLMLSATPAMAADQFDLICTADKSQVRYRVDLPRGEWCEGKCETLNSNATGSSGTLVLQNDLPQPTDNLVRRAEINRVSGEWRLYGYAPGTDKPLSTLIGRCKVAPFSNLPVAQF